MPMSPPTSPNPVESLRNKIINLSLNDIVCTLETQDGQFCDIEKVFPELPPYKPPKPSPEDIYIDEIHYHRIIPISKIMHKRPRKGKITKHYNFVVYLLCYYRLFVFFFLF